MHSINEAQLWPSNVLVTSVASSVGFCMISVSAGIDAYTCEWVSLLLSLGFLRFRLGLI